MTIFHVKKANYNCDLRVFSFNSLKNTSCNFHKISSLVKSVSEKIQLHLNFLGNACLMSRLIVASVVLDYWFKKISFLLPSVMLNLHLKEGFFLEEVSKK